ncbi:holo-ACP synthase [Vibrio sp. SM6]|uniref:Holo-[acyl-carrier-protein] synthase n=1 Tax=Vibrio agarilyticus TaxID=2726741 RepID=A0A7X8TRE1_9VIBR|nr:holo-ACP synthase [Vibrio agarilyticus]NLS12838.1 holo-ACP synthase [Vibrio agarilyticus]
MAICGFGTDIVEIARVEKALARSGRAFAERILTDAEMAQFIALKAPERFLAKRFAAKEAASKALGTGIACGVTFHDFQITNDELGRPQLTLQGRARELTHGARAHLTLSDEQHYAVASVILESI